MKESRKTQYTRKVIAETVLELLKKKDSNKITITEICHIADINRSTFYSHYKDLPHMFETLSLNLLKTIINDIEKYKTTSMTLIDYFTGLFHMLKMNNDTIEIILIHPNGNNLLDDLLKHIHLHSTSVLKQSIPQISDNDLDYVLGYTTNGCVKIIEVWIQNGMCESAEHMANLTNNIMSGMFTSEKNSHKDE